MTKVSQLLTFLIAIGFLPQVHSETLFFSSHLPEDIQRIFEIDGKFQNYRITSLASESSAENLISIASQPLYSFDQLIPIESTGSPQEFLYRQFLFTKNEIAARSFKIGSGPDYPLRLLLLSSEVAVSKDYSIRNFKWGPQNIESRYRATREMTYSFKNLATGFGELLMQSVTLERREDSPYLALRLLNENSNYLLFDINIVFDLKTSQGVSIPGESVVDFDFSPYGNVGLIYLNERGQLLKTRVEIPMDKINEIASLAKSSRSSSALDSIYQMTTMPIEIFANNTVGLSAQDGIKYRKLLVLDVPHQTLESAKLSCGALF